MSTPTREGAAQRIVADIDEQVAKKLAHWQFQYDAAVERLRTAQGEVDAAHAELTAAQDAQALWRRFLSEAQR